MLSRPARPRQRKGRREVGSAIGARILCSASRGDTILVRGYVPEMKTPSELFAEALAEQAAYEAWDHEMTPNPHDPWRAAEKLATAEAVPVLIDALERGEGVELAAHALEKLGRPGHAASAALEKRGELLAVFCVDEPRAREMGLHRRADLVRYDHTVRSVIAKRVWERGDATAHVAALLGDSDDEVVRFALDAGGRNDRSFLFDAARRTPSRVPVEQVRRLLSNLEFERAAGAILEAMHLPEDAMAVLSRMARHRASRAAVEWLGPLPESEALLETVSIADVFEITRRRRCSGLETDTNTVQPRLLEALRPTNDWRIVGAAARAVAELGLAPLLDAVVDGLAGARTHDSYGDVSLALAAFGESGIAAAQRGQTRWTGDGGDRLGWIVTEFAKGRLRGLSVDDGDARFIAGNLEDTTLVDNGAYGAYAMALLREPRNAAAAFQCAWIDRGFGTPITRARIEWLRALGICEELLDELAARPSAIVPNHRSAHRRETVNADLATIAEQAGLFGIAANYAEGDDRERLRARARAHVGRLSGAHGAHGSNTDNSS